MKVIKYVLGASALTLIFTSASFAQQASSNTTQKAEPESVTEKNFKNKMFEVKHRDPGSLVSVLWGLGSGFKGSTVMHNAELRTITVRDFPENLATMEEALKRLDIPSAPRPNIELHIHVLIASNAGGATSDAPANLKDVVTQLRGTLAYRNYELVASAVQRLTETSGGLVGNGVAEVPSLNPGTPSAAMPYEYHVRQVSLAQNQAGAPSLQIGQFAFRTLSDRENARIETALNLRDGEKVVVGTATLRSRALVIVLTAKVLN